MYDLRTATKYRILQYPADDIHIPRQPILGCGFSADGAKLAVYAADGSVTVWSLQATGLLDYFRKDGGRAAGRRKVVGAPVGDGISGDLLRGLSLSLAGDRAFGDKEKECFAKTICSKVQVSWRTADCVQVRRENDEIITMHIAEMTPL